MGYHGFFFSAFRDSAHLQIKSSCSFEGIIAGISFLTFLGGIFPFVRTEQIIDALEAPLDEL